MIFDVQKASMLKRVSAWLLDAILLVVLAAGFMALIGVISGYDKHYSAWTGFYTQYETKYSVDLDADEETVNALPEKIREVYDVAKAEYGSREAAIKTEIETQYGTALDLTNEEIDALPSDQANAYQSAVTSYNERLATAKEEIEADFSMSFDLEQEKMDAILNAGEEDIHYRHYMAVDELMRNDEAFQQEGRMVISLTLLITSIGIFLSVAVLYFVLPLVFKNGQTIGKKVFGIGLMHNNGVKVNTITVFIRAFLGTYAIELMVPLLLLVMVLFGMLNVLGLIIIGLIYLLDAGLLFFTKLHTPIHDLLAKTVAVDLASQQIFDTEEDMINARRTEGLEKISDGERADTIYRQQRTDVVVSPSDGTDTNSSDV